MMMGVMVVKDTPCRKNIVIYQLQDGVGGGYMQDRHCQLQPGQLLLAPGGHGAHCQILLAPGGCEEHCQLQPECGAHCQLQRVQLLLVPEGREKHIVNFSLANFCLLPGDAEHIGSTLPASAWLPSVYSQGT